MTIPVEDRTTGRLHLRRVSMGDLAAVVAIHSDPVTNQHRPGGAPSPRESEQAAREFVRGWEEHGVGYWAVELDGKLVGVVGVQPQLYRGRDCWNLYYRLAPEAWGKGLAVEASREAVAVAEALHPERPIVARTRPANSSAIRVAEGAGLDRRPDLDSAGFVVLARGWPAPKDDGVLDEAYERLSSYGPEFDGYLSNHGPMVVEVFERRGRPEATHTWLDEYTMRLEPAPTPRWTIGKDQWKEALGDSRRVGDWLSLFERELAERPWREVVHEWWARLMPGAVGSATHGLIRTGHALRAVERQESEWRVRELGVALGYWAARFHPLPATREPAGDLDPAQTLTQLPRIEDPNGGAETRVSQLASTSAWPDALAGLRPPAEAQQVPAELDALAEAAVAQYLGYGRAEPIMLVHAATAPSAAAAALPSLPIELWRLTWQEAWRASAAITACYAVTQTDEPAGLRSLTPDEVLSHAVENGDEHLIKFIDVALLAHQHGSGAGLAAASHAVSLFE